jgi:hypothetical protein
MLLGQRELRERLQSTLNGGRRTGWNDDEPAVVEAACELAARRFFGASYDVRTVTAFVWEMREATANDPPLDQLKAEAVIRLALGDKEVDTEGITPGQKYLIRCQATTYASAKLGLGEAEIDQMITDAEKIAVERGWDPPIEE